MTDHEHIAAIKAAHEALVTAVAAAQEAGLVVNATLAQNYYGPWSLQLSIIRKTVYAETDGRYWKEARVQPSVD